jgi:hypothetical protein
MDKIPESNIVSVNFVLFSLLCLYGDLVMQASLLIHMVWFINSYAYLRLPHILKHQN